MCARREGVPAHVLFMTCVYVFVTFVSRLVAAWMGL